MPHRQQARTGQAVQADVASGVAELVADADRPRAWTLRVDGIPQSHVNLDDPEYLEFEYMRRLGQLANLATPAGEPLRVLHLGGGGLTLARYVAATRPGSRQLAVDSDAALVDLVRRLLPLDQPGRRAAAGRASAGRPGAGRPGPARIRVRVGDARAVLEEVRAASFDLVIADLFAGARTPPRRPPSSSRRRRPPRSGRPGSSPRTWATVRPSPMPGPGPRPCGPFSGTRA